MTSTSRWASGTRLPSLLRTRRRRPGSVGNGDKLGRIACPPRSIDNVDLLPKHPFDSGNGLQNAAAMPVATIKDTAFAPVSQILERGHMSQDQVRHMNIVPNTGAVWRIVISPEDLHVIVDAEGRAHQRLQEVSRGRV